MISNYIKNLVSINKTSNETIATLEDVIESVKIENDKDKANFGNLCLILKANRIIAEATEAMLINENVLMDDDGNYYQKIEDDAVSLKTEKADENENESANNKAQ